MNLLIKSLKKPLPAIIFFVIALLLFLPACFDSSKKIASTVSSETLPNRVDFNFHIKPILSDRCFACHGPDANSREAGLRLDTEEGAFAMILMTSCLLLNPI